MKRLTAKNIAISLLVGIVVGGVDWLLQFTTWFSQDSYSWWRSGIVGCFMTLLWLFVIIPIGNKEKAKREKKSEIQ